MVELQALNYVIQKRDATFFLNNALDEKFFPTYSKEYQFITDHITKYGVTPDMTTVLSKFPEFIPAETNEAPDYLSSQLRQEFNSQVVINNCNEVINLFRSGKIEDGISKATSVGNNIVNDGTVKSIDLIRDVHRYDSYVEMSNNLDKSFVTTGFPEIDNILGGGWNRSTENVTIVARPGVGKSWILLKCAVAAAEQGLKVGLYSGEMDEDMVGFRMDTLIGHIPNSRISHGDISVQAEYKDYIDHLSKQIPGSILILTPAMNNKKLATVKDLKRFIEQEKLDMLCIDQHSLMADDSKTRDPIVKASNISLGIATLQSTEHIPIISASQQNRGKDEDEERDLDLTRIAQSDRIGQDSSVVLFLQHDHNNDILTITMAKVRSEHTGKKLKYAIDLNKGIFNYLPTGTEAESSSAVHELKAEYDGYDASQEDIEAYTGEDIF